MTRIICRTRSLRSSPWSSPILPLLRRYLEGALREACDFLIPMAAGQVGEDHIVGEIGGVLTGKVPGRRSPDEITVFESLGIGIYDLAAAERVWRNAETSGQGIRVMLGGRREHA